MPGSAEILAGLTAIANEAIVVAVGWHVAVALAIVAIAMGWRPRERAARTLLALPLASVGAVALVFANPFNGIVFIGGAVVLLALARRGRDDRVRRGPSWALWAGGASLAFGWVYPHFLDAHPAVYLFAAPLGLVPCPTLAAAIGAALLGGALGARAFSLALAALSLFYGVFGVLHLGVLLDLGLVIGATLLLLAALRIERMSPKPPHPKSFTSVSGN
jgi:hypothetical protein